MGTSKFTETTIGERTVVAWEDLKAGDIGAPYTIKRGATIVATFEGKFNEAAPVALLGSNTGREWFALTDVQHRIAQKVRRGILTITACPPYVRPEVCKGEGVAVTVALSII